MAQSRKHDATSFDLNKKSTSTIRGRVIYSDTGHPVRRAEVTLVAQNAAESGRIEITDRNGEFTFTNVNLGNYFLVVSAPDVVSPFDQIGRRNSLALGIALGKIVDGYSEVTVDGRGAVKTEIMARRGGVITGRVLAENDTPIASARINLFKIEDGKPQSVRRTSDVPEVEKHLLETDSRGIYRIGGLDAGEYIVRAAESDEGEAHENAIVGSYANGSRVVVYYPKAVRLEDAATVLVQTGSETRNVEIRVPERALHRIAGTVLVRGEPVRGASIRLSRGEPEFIRSSFFHDAETDETGNWEILSVPDGSYSLSVSGLAVGLVHMREDFVSVARHRQPVVVAGSDLTNLKTELTEAGVLEGVVSVEGGRPIPDRLVVEAVSVANNSQSLANSAGEASLTREVKSGDDFDEAHIGFVKEGRVSFFHLEPGLFSLRIAGTNMFAKSITLNGKDVYRNPIQVDAGKTVRGLCIVLSNEFITLTGYAANKSDRTIPLANASVFLFPVEPERRRIIDEPLTARTDKEGRFSIAGPPGEYFVFVYDRPEKGSYITLPTEEIINKNSGPLHRVRLAPGEQKTVEVVGG